MFYYLRSNKPLHRSTVLASMLGALIFFCHPVVASQKTQVEAKPTVESTLNTINNTFKNTHVEVIEWPQAALARLGSIKPSAFVATHRKSKKGKRPLLISLHGGGGKAATIAEQLSRSARVKGLALAEKSNRDLIVFEPNSSDSWDPVTLNYALTLFLERYPEVDTKRIYLIGHSMGGTGTLNWALHNPDLFAAVSPSGFRLKAPIASVDSLANLPIWLAVGSEDGVRPQDVMSVYLALQKAGNKQVGYTAFPGANHPKANAAVFSSLDIIEWFLSHSKG
jgi:predicted peptidase